jgi:transcriptional regulator with XRE-family HTH domain
MANLLFCVLIDPVKKNHYYLTGMNTTLAGRLDSLIIKLGVKKRDFAQKIGFTNAYISMILSGKKTNPSLRFFDSVSREFCVNTAWLRDGRGQIFSAPGLDVSDMDASLLAKYRLLPPDERAMIDTLVDALLLKSMTGQEKK